MIELMVFESADDCDSRVVDERHARRTLIRPDTCHHNIDVFETFSQCRRVAWSTFDDVDIGSEGSLEIRK